MQLFFLVLWCVNKVLYPAIKCLKAPKIWSNLLPLRVQVLLFHIFILNRPLLQKKIVFPPMFKDIILNLQSL